MVNGTDEMDIANEMRNELMHEARKCQVPETAAAYAQASAFFSLAAALHRLAEAVEDAGGTR